MQSASQIFQCSGGRILALYWEERAAGCPQFTIEPAGSYPHAPVLFEHFGHARPNKAHEALAAWEARGLLRALITQNVDNLHHIAGSLRTLAFARQRRWQKTNLAVLN